MNNDYIQVYRDPTGKYRWRLRSANHRVLAHGESHRDARDAERAARRSCPHVTDVRRV